jgi:hypothetical protein
VAKNKNKPKKSARDHLLIDDGSVVNKQAKAAFAKWQPPTWVDNELEYDRGIDYHIQLGRCVGGKRVATGDLFYVQLKGDPNPKFVHNGSVLSYGVELRHLNFWYAEIKQPLYLLVVDLASGKGYWLFMQEYLRENKKWQKKRTGLDVQIPVSQCWDDVDGWEADIRRAIIQMHALSTTLENVAKYSLGQMNLLDRRFRVEARMTTSGCQYLFSAVEAVELTMSIKTESGDRQSEIFSQHNKGGGGSSRRRRTNHRRISTVREAQGECRRIASGRRHSRPDRNYGSEFQR